MSLWARKLSGLPQLVGAPFHPILQPFFSSTPSLFLQKILREIRLRDYWNLVEFVVKAINCVNDSTVERTHSFCHEETGIYKKIIKVILKNLIITGSCSEII